LPGKKGGTKRRALPTGVKVAQGGKTVKSDNDVQAEEVEAHGGKKGAVLIKRTNSGKKRKRMAGM